ncbi:hypothetical protein Goarm_022520, partial [Gossypium armourianum]|nr:hypothetical protein [Gossypium armourianum]
ALGHVDEAVSDIFDRLDKGVTPVPPILAETFRSLNACSRAGEGRFIGCTQLLLAWFHIPLLGIWGAVGYAPLLILRQYGSRQFMPAKHGLAQCEFSYRGDNYKKKVKEISQAWNQVHRMKRLDVGSMTTLEYGEWRSKRINDNIPELNSEGVQPMEEYLQVIPSELEIIKQDFERRNLELEKKIEQLEEEKVHLKLDADVQKLEAEKLRKGKNKAEEDLDSLKTDYKKLRLSMRTAGLGKTSE